MDFHLLVILSCLLVAGTAHEKRSSAGPPNNFLDAFYAQWTCNEKDELLNEYEMTSLIFKETLKIFIKMTEGNKLSDCYTNDVTSSTSNGPQVMYLYTTRNHMCNKTQHILTTFNKQSSSNYVSCLLHDPTRITSTAFVATAVCANIYDKIDLSPAIASVTCLGDDVWAFYSGVPCRNGIGATNGQILDNVDLKICKESCAAVAGCEGVVRKQADASGKGKCWHKHHIDLNICEKNSKKYDLYLKPQDLDDCQYGNGANYTGSVSVTKSGLQCQKWSSQSPHEHPWGDLGDHNYCRNPNPIAENGVWCYTTDSNVRFERCGVPVCGCPAGWTNLTTGCYKLTNVGTHRQATDDCKKDGGYLVEIDSQEENNALSPYYKNVNAWLGATDIEKEGEWVWSHSGRKVSFTNWQGREPTGRTRENCLQFTNYQVGSWNDAACGEKTKGVCELDTEI